MASSQWDLNPGRRNARPAGNFSPATAGAAQTCAIGLQPVFRDSAGVSGSYICRADCVSRPGAFECPDESMIGTEKV